MTNTYINGLRRAQHRPSEYLTDLQLAAQDQHSSQGRRSSELDALDALPDIELDDALVTLPVPFRLAFYCCEGTVVSRVHRGGQRLRILLRTTHGQA